MTFDAPLNGVFKDQILDKMPSMSENNLRLSSPPIVEAVVDIDCDMPVNFNLLTLEAEARSAFGDRYPIFQTQVVEQHQFEPNTDGPAKHRRIRQIQAFQFRQVDKNQLVQVRTQGFSFNRLAPYSNLDDYVMEIERTWSLFVDLTAPIQVKGIRLRYINRLNLPLRGGALETTDFLRISPQLPEQSNLEFSGFLHQHSAVEKGTGNQANIVLASQQIEGSALPMIFDIGVYHAEYGKIENWGWIVEQIMSLRSLKNRIFENTLTESCLNLYRNLG
ncbi:TIGR04255 family protein [Phragmitibacter flavus]|uniref:TIGR04255 family protein n=1 Tax=Phragmitibacter flavus TaxID=2576071 RepID=A0A5R8KKA7_9BACT|nr:TIGR04255 family protein [Phragmitibacter flavus]TLD72687.1 TIGR04255 family protein [Phragmitibacter flavus]